MGTVNGPQHCRATADGYRPGAASQTAMDFLEGYCHRSSNRLCVEVSLSAGWRRNLLSELWIRISIAYAIGRGVSNADYLVSYRIHKMK